MALLPLSLPPPPEILPSISKLSPTAFSISTASTNPLETQPQPQPTTLIPIPIIVQSLSSKSISTITAAIPKSLPFKSLRSASKFYTSQFHPTKNASRGFTTRNINFNSARGRKTYLWWKCDSGMDHVWFDFIDSRDEKRREGFEDCPCCIHVKLSHSNSIDKCHPVLCEFFHETLNVRVIDKLIPSDDETNIVKEKEKEKENDFKILKPSDIISPLPKSHPYASSPNYTKPGVDLKITFVCQFDPSTHIWSLPLSVAIGVFDGPVLPLPIVPPYGVESKYHAIFTSENVRLRCKYCPQCSNRSVNAYNNLLSVRPNFKSIIYRKDNKGIGLEGMVWNSKSIVVCRELHTVGNSKGDSGIVSGHKRSKTWKVRIVDLVSSQKNKTPKFPGFGDFDLSKGVEAKLDDLYDDDAVVVKVEDEFWERVRLKVEAEEVAMEIEAARVEALNIVSFNSENSDDNVIRVKYPAIIPNNSESRFLSLEEREELKLANELAELEGGESKREKELIDDVDEEGEDVDAENSEESERNGGERDDEDGGEDDDKVKESMRLPPINGKSEKKDGSGTSKPRRPSLVNMLDELKSLAIKILPGRRGSVSK